MKCDKCNIRPREGYLCNRKCWKEQKLEDELSITAGTLSAAIDAINAISRYDMRNVDYNYVYDWDDTDEIYTYTGTR